MKSAKTRLAGVVGWVLEDELPRVGRAGESRPVGCSCDMQNARFRDRELGLRGDLLIVEAFRAAVCPDDLEVVVPTLHGCHESSLP